MTDPRIRLIEELRDDLKRPHPPVNPWVLVRRLDAILSTPVSESVSPGITRESLKRLSPLAKEALEEAESVSREDVEGAYDHIITRDGVLYHRASASPDGHDTETGEAHRTGPEPPKATAEQVGTVTRHWSATPDGTDHTNNRVVPQTEMNYRAPDGQELVGWVCSYAARQRVGHGFHLDPVEHCPGPHQPVYTKGESPDGYVSVGELVEAKKDAWLDGHAQKVLDFLIAKAGEPESSLMEALERMLDEWRIKRDQAVRDYGVGRVSDLHAQFVEDLRRALSQSRESPGE